MTDDKIWFIVKGHEEQGPYTPSQLQNMLHTGSISNAQALRRKGDMKQSTVGKALALKKQVQKNQMQALVVQHSGMQAMVKSTAFRALLLFVLLLVVTFAALYFSGKYQDEPFAHYFRILGLH